MFPTKVKYKAHIRKEYKFFKSAKGITSEQKQAFKAFFKKYGFLDAYKDIHRFNSFLVSVKGDQESPRIRWYFFQIEEALLDAVAIFDKVDALASSNNLPRIFECFFAYNELLERIGYIDHILGSLHDWEVDVDATDIVVLSHLRVALLRLYFLARPYEVEGGKELSNSELRYTTSSLQLTY